MKTEPSAPIKVKLEKNDSSYSSSANTHHSVKQETKVNFNLDIKPSSIKSYHENLEIDTSASKVTRTRKVRRKAGGGRKVSTKRKSTYKRKTKGRRRRRTTTGTTTTRKTTRRKRTSKKLVTGKALTPRARICKKLGIERNLSLGIHSLPTIRKMTQENTINHKRAAAGIGVLSLFGSELNSHGSVPLRDDGPDIDTDLSGVDDRSPLPDEQEDSYGPQLPPEDIPLENDNIDNSNNHNSDTKINNLTSNNDNNDIITTDNNNIESTYNNENHDELPVIDIKPPVQVNESIIADQTITPSEDIKLPSTTEERETTDPDGESKAKLKRCKHGKIIHAKKHDNNSSSKSKRSSSKDNKKEDHKSSLLRTIKKEPRDRDEEMAKDSRENRASRSSLPNRHDVDNHRRLITHDERTSKHRENDRNRENHLREDRTHSDKRKRSSASKEILSPSSTLPISATTTTTTTTTLLSHLPLSAATPSTIRSRSDDASKRRSSSSHRRDSSRNNRSPTRKESRKTSPHHDPIENKTSDNRKKSDPEEDDKSKGKKKKRKHKHKHSKYSDEDDYRETKSAKHYDPIEISNGKRIPTNSTSDKLITSSTNNSRHQDHHKKSSSKHRHHSRDGQSSPLSSSHKVTSPLLHREDRDEKPSVSRSRTKRARHSSPSDRDHISNRNRDERRESIQTKSGKILSSVNSTTNEVNTKEIKVKIEDAKDYKDHKEHGIPTNLIGNNTNNVNNSNSKVSRSPTEIKSVLSKPGSPPKKDVRLVSKSRTEFDIFWDENSQNKKVDGSHVDFDPNSDKSGKEETGLRFLPRTLLSDQSSPNVHLPPTVGPRTPPDDERAEKNVILSSPDQTMPTPIQDESLEGDYSNGTPTKQQGSIKSLNSPSIDPDIYDPEAPLDSPEDDQLIKSEIARSQAKLNEMEKKLSPSEKQIPAVETVPRPETPELPSSHTNNNNTPTTTNQHKFKSPIIPPLSSSTPTCRAPTLAESSLPPAPGSLLAQIQKTLNLQTKTHSSHSDSSKQSHPSHSGSTGILSSSTSSSLQSSTFLHAASGSSGNDQTNKSSSSNPTLAPNINSLSPSLKSLLENLIKAAEQQQSKTKSSKMVPSSNVNNIFKKPAPVLDSKSRSVSHSHHHSVKTKVIDKEPTKKVTSSVNQGPTPIAPAPQGMKLTDVAVLDDVPSSAVELQVKEKYLKKLNRQERVVEEVKMVLKPFYQRKEITKDEYKEIMRKAVPKICHSKSGEINPQKVRLLVEGYCQRYKHDRKKSKTVKGK